MSEQTPEVIPPNGAEVRPEDITDGESIEEPAKVIRIGAMIRTLLNEVRDAQLDEKSRERMKEIYETSISELSGGLSPDLQQELKRLATQFDDKNGMPPSESELRIAQAQLVGWLEGLFHGIQATLVAQQVAAQSQLQQMQTRGLPAAPRSEDDPTSTGYL
jgi:hypothetical protein